MELFQLGYLIMIFIMGSLSYRVGDTLRYTLLILIMGFCNLQLLM